MPGKPNQSLVAVVNEKVVRNGWGTLDFYYQFSDFQTAGTSPNWLEIQLINQCSLPLGYISDGPGDISPTDGVSGVLQNAEPSQYAAFNISSNAGASTSLSTKWLLMRTSATGYVTYPSKIFFADQPIDQFFGEGAAPPIGSPPPDVALYFPDVAPVIPEPASLGLLPLALVALCVRFRSHLLRA